MSQVDATESNPPALSAKSVFNKCIGEPNDMGADTHSLRVTLTPAEHAQHPSMARVSSSARRCNHHYDANLFQVPCACLAKTDYGVDTDGRKMSHSYGNRISRLHTQQSQKSI